MNLTLDKITTEQQVTLKVNSFYKIRGMMVSAYIRDLAVESKEEFEELMQSEMGKKLLEQYGKNDQMKPYLNDLVKLRKVMMNAEVLAESSGPVINQHTFMDDDAFKAFILKNPTVISELNLKGTISEMQDQCIRHYYLSDFKPSVDLEAKIASLDDELWEQYTLLPRFREVKAHLQQKLIQANPAFNQENENLSESEKLRQFCKTIKVNEDVQDTLKAIICHKIWGQYRFVALLNQKFDLLSYILGEALLDAAEPNPEWLRFALIKLLGSSIQSATLETVVSLFDDQLWEKFCQTEKMRIQLEVVGKTSQQYKDSLKGQGIDQAIKQTLLNLAPIYDLKEFKEFLESEKKQEFVELLEGKFLLQEFTENPDGLRLLLQKYVNMRNSNEIASINRKFEIVQSIKLETGVDNDEELIRLVFKHGEDLDAIYNELFKDSDLD